MELVRENDEEGQVYRRIVETVRHLNGLEYQSYTVDGRGGSKRATGGRHKLVRVTFNVHPTDPSKLFYHLETTYVVPKSKYQRGDGEWVFRLQNWKRLKAATGKFVDQMRTGSIRVDAKLHVATLVLQMSRRDAYDQLVTDYHAEANEKGFKLWGQLVLEHLSLKKEDVYSPSINVPGKCWVSDKMGNMVVEGRYLTSVEKKGLSPGNFYAALEE